jgi:hypothetical protein
MHTGTKSLESCRLTLHWYPTFGNQRTVLHVVGLYSAFQRPTMLVEEGLKLSVLNFNLCIFVDALVPYLSDLARFLVF